MPFEVTLTLRGIVCPSATKVSVPLAVKDRPSPVGGVKATASPQELSFDVPAGSYATTDYSSTVAAALVIKVDANAPAGHDHSFDVTATLAGAMPQGCQGTAPPPAAEATANHKIVTGQGSSPSAMPSHTMGDGSTMTSASPTSPTPKATAPAKTPAPGLLLVGVAILIVAFWRKR